MKYLLTGTLLCLLTISCTKEKNSTEPKLIFRFRFDSTQVRLDSNGQPASVPNGRAAQSPIVNNMSVHSIELSPNASTPLMRGAVIYTGEETTEGGDTAINFIRSVLSGNYEVFYALSLKEIPAGDYEYLRLSVAYQNYTLHLHIDSTINDSVTVKDDFFGTIASFIGYKTYITSYSIRNEFITLDSNMLQGYWGLEVPISSDGFNETITLTGQAPAGTTTVVNPIHATSPLPIGSSAITAAFGPQKLTITGNETDNIIVEVILSTNKSFEWQEITPDGKWEPLKEPVLDMGLRGMVLTIQ